MKAYLSGLWLAATSLSAFSVAAQGQPTTPAAYLGTWQLVSSTYTRGDSTSKRDSSTIAEYKVITPNWFMYTIFEKATNTFLGSTCGPLTIIGDKMTNTAEYSSMENRKGRTNIYTVNVKGNILYQKGKNGDNELEEVWVKRY